MNYYLARDGTTYGPYPQESIPAMVQQGQLVPEDLLCPEGGSDWTPLSQLPALMSPGAAPATTGSKLRISTAPSYSHAPAAAATPMPAYTPAPQRASAIEKAGGLWGVLKIVGYVVVGIIVVGGGIGGYMASQRDRKEIEKLHSLAGWSAFDAANQKIDSESSVAGYGNNNDATKMSELLANALDQGRKAYFPIDKSSSYRGRSKLARLASAADSASAGNGHFQTFIELRKDRAVILIHVPEFHRYKNDVRKDMTEMCWEGSLVMCSQLQKMEEQLSSGGLAALAAMAGGAVPGANPAVPTPGTTPGTRPPAGGRPQPGRATTGRPPGNRPPGPAGTGGSAAAAAAPPPKPEPKFKKDMPLIVGVRGSDGYECVFSGTLSNPEDSPPSPTKKNVPSHKMLVDWFGSEKPQ